MTIYDIVKKLIGEIRPYGATHIDKQRKENLQEHIRLLNELIDDLIMVSEYKDRLEDSMKSMGNIAYNNLIEIKDDIEEIMNEKIEYQKCKLCKNDTGKENLEVCNKCASEYKF